MTTPTPLQRLSEIVEAGTPPLEADGGLVPMALMTLVASAVRLARFLASPEAVEVLAMVIAMERVPGQASKLIAIAVLNTIAEQALKEPSHG